MGESIREFLDSFSYGSRNDLSFKFLKGMSEEEASQFLSLLLTKVGELYDGAPSDDLIDLAYQWQVDAYTPKPGAERKWVYEDGPFTPLSKPLDEMNVGLVTSSGHFTNDDPPGDGRATKSQEEIVKEIDDFLTSTPELSEIPTSHPTEELNVRHPGYDTRSSALDAEVALPIRALERAASRGSIGSVSSPAYSFVGAASQLRLRADRDGWVDLWQEAGVEALFLVPV